MITLYDLNEAIKECEGQRNPTANTAVKLAAFYTIKNELYPTVPPDIGYSYDPPKDYESRTDFGKAVQGKDPVSVLEIFDDLMSLLKTAQPRLYRRLIETIQEL